MTPRRDLTQRGFDLAIAGLLLLVTAPVWPVISIAVKLDSPGPVLFRGRRMGRDASEFSILKFRSMRSIGPGSGPAVTMRGDERITRVGRVLRLAKLDELPQLINVIRGEMSMVGWRPEDPRYRASYPVELLDIFQFRPGITGPAALEFRHEEAILASHGEHMEDVYVNEILPAKVAIDLAYCRQAGLATDLRVLLATVGSVARRRS